MTLPARQQRVLDQIEVTLQARDPRLMSLFATFARLTWHEAMPTTEQLGARLSGMLRPVLLIPALLVAMVSIALLASFTTATPHCPATPVSRGPYTSWQIGNCHPDGSKPVHGIKTVNASRGSRSFATGR